MRIVVAGGSGFLGRPLMRGLRAAGHEVVQLVRREPDGPGQLRWRPGTPVELPEGTGAVVNLCGAGVGDKRWTAAYKREIRDSRVVTTSTLAQAVARQRIPVLVNGSGVGFYGDTGSREVDESAPAGTDFLAGVAVEWEGATAPAADAGSRVVILRTGMVLDRRGGLLKPQLLPFKLGVGGTLGSGAHWIPWIALADWVRAAEFAIATECLEGPVNVTGPQPVTNKEFTKEFARALRRPALFRIPKLAIQVLYGGFADEAFRSQRVMPKKLRDNGFTYQYPTLPEALAAALR